MLGWAKWQMGESGCSEQHIFSDLENLLELLFLCSLEYIEFWIEILKSGRVEHYLHRILVLIFWNLEMSLSIFLKKWPPWSSNKSNILIVMYSL
jgi:hypothetical protein